MDIGKKIKQIRTERKLTAKELSEKSGIPEKSIYKIESGGVKDPRISSIKSIAAGLECSIDELTSEIDSYVVTTQMISLLTRSTTFEGIDREYLISRIDEFRKQEYSKMLQEKGTGIDEELAEDLTIMKILKSKKTLSNKEKEFLKHLNDLYS